MSVDEHTLRPMIAILQRHFVDIMLLLGSTFASATLGALYARFGQRRSR